MTRCRILVCCTALLAAALVGCPADTESCTPACDGNTCGSDGCGGRCGCAEGAFCNEESLACCAPSCDGRNCGTDGCGGTCGECGNGATCNPRVGRCQGGCTPSCDGRTCGSDGCGGSCGTCDGVLVCNQSTGRCGEACQPVCGGKVCGDDGCGGLCGSCGDGAACDSGVCVAGPACDDLVRNGNEADVDCGGSCEGKCPVGKACGTPSDCGSGLCQSNVCAPGPLCANNGKDAWETDTDCGGKDCAPCAKGKYCVKSSDCLTDACVFGVCELPTCTDQIRNQDETGIDCGGPCDGCLDGTRCLDAGDCTSLNCSAGRCISCYDLVKNGTETDRDCGGGMCQGCANELACRQGSDCAGGGCENSACCTANACGFCGALSDETCDGKDNDCNGATDDNLGEGQLCPKQAAPCAGARAGCRGAAGWVCDDQAYADFTYQYRPTETGYCDDSLDNDCDGKKNYDDTADCCKADCTNKDCGGDGCGGTCGTCAAKESCSTEGTCEAQCGAFPSTTCDGYCGQQYGSGSACYCYDYMCQQDPANCCPDFKSCCGTCTPSCAGRECGDNGCGGSCGSCTGGKACSPSGKCETVACGADPQNSCNQYCGQAWNMYYSCSCAASCATSPTGCCADYASCCAVTDPCQGIGEIGCCKNNTVYYCSSGSLVTDVCTGGSAGYDLCGWYPGDASYMAGYYCTDTTAADPAGTYPKACPF